MYAQFETKVWKELPEFCSTMKPMEDNGGGALLHDSNHLFVYGSHMRYGKTDEAIKRTWETKYDYFKRKYSISRIPRFFFFDELVRRELRRVKWYDALIKARDTFTDISDEVDRLIGSFGFMQCVEKPFEKGWEESFVLHFCGTPETQEQAPRILKRAAEILDGDRNIPEPLARSLL